MAQTVWPVGGAQWAGVKRHYYTGGEQTYFTLVNNDGTPYTTGVSAGNINTAEVLATVTLPIGSTNDLHTSPAASTLRNIGGASGTYGLALFGEGAAGGHDICLKYIGDCAVWIRPTGSATFLPIVLNYSVRADWDVQAVLTCVPGTGGASDQVSAAISVYRWSNHVQLDKPLDTAGALNSRTSHLTLLTLKITDANSTLATFTQAGGDFTQGADSNIYLLKAIAGLTGARSLNANVSFSYVDDSSTVIDTFSKNFGLEAPSAS